MTTDSMSDLDVVRRQRIAGIRARGLQSELKSLDPQRNLIGHPSAQDPTVKSFRQAGSLPLAHALLLQGSDESVRRGAAIVDAVLDSQELSPDHPHCGNWRWLADDLEISDLNAVQFVLRGLLPLLLECGHHLPPALLARCRNSVRAALAEEERLDVAPTYSNIHLMSLFALLVGGEWLGDEHYLALGKRRWERWVRFTVESGAPHEFNSTSYVGIDLSALAALVNLVQDPRIKLQARLLYERIWLHLALHLHVPTGQQVGPHCRSYWAAMTSGRSGVKDTLWRETGWDWTLRPGPYGGEDIPPDSLDLALTPHSLPGYLATWLARQTDAMPYEVRETANRGEGFDLTTYYTPNYALGTAARTYAIGTDCFYIEHQANYLMLHYRRPQETGAWGMMYSRYVVNDRHWGTLGAAPDRPKTYNFYDQGHFAGVQSRNKAIGVYALMPEQAEVHSLKTVVVFQSGASLEHIWVNDSAVDLECTPQTLTVDDWLIVEDGAIYVGVRPLQPTHLGKDASIQLERGPLGELWLTIYNYKGVPIRLWEYASLRGAFWRGNLRAGFVVEVSERSAYPSAADFLAHLHTSQISDGVDDASIRTVTYSSGDESISLRYDLWNTRPLGRFLNGSAYTPPNLASPLAVQSDTGVLRVGGAVLRTAPQQVWLVAQEVDPGLRTYVAVNPQPKPTPLHLETPFGIISSASWGMGRIEWRIPANGEQSVHIDALETLAQLDVPENVRIIYTSPAISAS